MKLTKNKIQTLKTIAFTILASSFWISSHFTYAHSATMMPSVGIDQADREMQQGHWSAAETQLRRALELDSHNASAHSELGYAYLYGGDAARAAEEFQAALRLHPHLVSAENGLHQTFRTKSDHDAYFQSVQDEVKKDPNSADAHVTLAEELMERNQNAQALNEAQTALRLSPNVSHAYCVLGRVAAQQGQDIEAHKDLEIAVKRDRNDDDAWAGLGDLAMKSKNYPEAVHCYGRATEAAPDHADWHNKLAAAFTADGHASAAARENTRASRLAPPSN